MKKQQQQQQKNNNKQTNKQKKKKTKKKKKTPNVKPQTQNKEELQQRYRLGMVKVYFLDKLRKMRQ